jgi:hypothetical protein
MIGTGKMLGVVSIGPAQPIATMMADIEKGPDLTIAVPHHQHRVLTHVGAEEVAGTGDLTFVAEEQPTAGKDRF